MYVINSMYYYSIVHEMTILIRWKYNQVAFKKKIDYILSDCKEMIGPTILYYYIMGKISHEGNISNFETVLWTRGEAEGLINRSRLLLIFPRDDLAMLYIIL